MSHRKIQSKGNIPFSWEDKPGVSRMTTQQECPSDKGLRALGLESSTPTTPSPAPASRESNGISLTADEILKIPLPPCPSLRPPRRSNSAKGIIGWWHEDPFLVAYKECTKNSSKKSSNNATTSTTVGSKPKRKSKFLFSCKSSCEIREDNFVRFSNLPPLPKDRIRKLR